MTGTPALSVAWGDEKVRAPERRAGDRSGLATQREKVGQLEIGLPGAHCGYERSPFIVAED